MKRMRIDVNAAASAGTGWSLARRAVKQMRDLYDTLEMLYETDEELFDELDLHSLDNELSETLMFTAPTVDKGGK